MVDTNKKNVEKRVLSCIYNLDNYYYEPCEQPDFVMKHKNLDYKWGVEITSVFFNETSARLKKITNYGMELLENQKYRHKVDKKYLKVDTAVLSREGKEIKKIKGIFSEVPKIDNYLKLVSDIICRKSDSLKKYSTELTHSNLIINDEENYFGSANATDFNKHFFTEEIINSIIKTKFREIYFLTLIKDHRKVYFPLKLILFVSKFYKFNYMYKCYYAESEKRNANQYFNYFLKHLCDLGLQDAYLLIENNQLAFYYARSKFTIKDRKLNIFEEPDWVIPSEAKLFNEVVLDVSIEDGFNNYLLEEDRKFNYLVELFFDSKV